MRRSAGILEVEIEDDAADEIASRSRGTPRIANRILRRVRDVAEVRHAGKITNDVAREALELLEVDGRGLERIDRELLSAVAEKFGGGPVGLSTLAVALGEETDTIEDVYEPYLLQLGFLQRTPRGRIITDLGPQARRRGARRRQPLLVAPFSLLFYLLHFLYFFYPLSSSHLVFLQRTPLFSPSSPTSCARTLGAARRHRPAVLMPELWIPGTAGGRVDELVKRIERRIEGFRAEHGLERAGVSVELTDGSLHRLASISAEPGFGFITLCPHCDQGEPEELIVPIGAVREIRIGLAEDEPRFGFAPPEEPASA